MAELAADAMGAPPLAVEAEHGERVDTGAVVAGVVAWFEDAKVLRTVVAAVAVQVVNHAVRESHDVPVLKAGEQIVRAESPSELDVAAV
jgi:hypothetical protein